MREERSAALDNRCRQWRGLILITGALLVQSAYPQTASIQKDSFESGTIQSSIWHASDTDGCSASVQTGDAADGTRYMRSSLTANPPNGGNFRCELNARGIDRDGKEGDTVYYGLSYRMPAATPYDPLTGDTLTQWHQQPLTEPKCHQVIQLDNNVLKWHNHSCNGAGGGDVTLLSAMPKDTWVRVCLKAKWTTQSNGELKIWVNPSSEASATVKNFVGQTLIDGYTNLVKFKIGNYKTRWRTSNPPSNMAAMSPRIFDHDDVRVGLSFAEACGGGSDQSEPPIPIPGPPISVAVE